MAQQYAQTDSQLLEQCDDGQQDSGVRRSQREPKPTEVSLQYRAEQARKAEGIFQKHMNHLSLSYLLHGTESRENVLKKNCIFASRMSIKNTRRLRVPIMT